MHTFANVHLQIHTHHPTTHLHTPRNSPQTERITAKYCKSISMSWPQWFHWRMSGPRGHKVLLAYTLSAGKNSDSWANAADRARCAGVSRCHDNHCHKYDGPTCASAADKARLHQRQSEQISRMSWRVKQISPCVHEVMSSDYRSYCIDKDSINELTRVLVRLIVDIGALSVSTQVHGEKVIFLWTGRWTELCS